MDLSHRLVRLITVEVWTCCLLLEPFTDAPLTNMLQALTATSSVENNMVAKPANVL